MQGVKYGLCRSTAGLRAAFGEWTCSRNYGVLHRVVSTQDRNLKKTARQAPRESQARGRALRTILLQHLCPAGARNAHGRLQLAHRKQGTHKMFMRTQPKKHVQRELTKRRHAPIGEPKLCRLRISFFRTFCTARPARDIDAIHCRCWDICRDVNAGPDFQ